jgi:hypothetical protein
LLKQGSNKSKIAFIIPYFGKWPVWFPAFLKSCATNPSIDWIFFTDCNLDFKAPANTIFHLTSLQEIQQVISAKVGVTVNSPKPVKFCDLKPTYGQVFETYLAQYDFWGFCDIDIIWGDIRKFITEEMLNTYDIISSRIHTISGHFTLLRNNSYCNTLYKKDEVYKELFVQENYKWFDEDHFARIVAGEVQHNQLAVYWDQHLVNNEKGRDSHQEYKLDKWLFDKGKLFDISAPSEQPVEHMYLHFINWKIKMKTCDIKPENEIFYISYTGIHSSPHSFPALLANKIQNVFYGYYVREGIRIRKKKLKSLKKRAVNKLKRILKSGNAS